MKGRSQFDMVEEIVGRPGEAPREAMNIFSLVSVQVRGRFRAGELVKQPTSLLPPTSITADRNGPRINRFAHMSLGVGNTGAYVLPPAFVETQVNSNTPSSGMLSLSDGDWHTFREMVNCLAAVLQAFNASVWGLRKNSSSHLLTRLLGFRRIKCGLALCAQSRPPCVSSA